MVGSKFLEVYDSEKACLFSSILGLDLSDLLGKLSELNFSLDFPFFLSLSFYIKSSAWWFPKYPEKGI